MTSIVLRPGDFTLSIGIDKAHVLSYDWDGRPMTAFLDERTYKRGLDNRVLMIWGERKGGVKLKQRRFLTSAEGAEYLARLHDLAESVNVKCRSGEVEIIQPADGEPYPLNLLHGWLDRIVSLEPSTLENDRERFRNVYKPIGILPPDQYLSIILQGTEGCSYNRCTFCNFYRETDFRIKSPEEFSHHIHKVKEFLGRSIGYRKSIFFADANALVIPRDNLIPMLEMIGKEFPIKGENGLSRDSGVTTPHFFRGIHSFIDSFSGPKKGIRDFVELRELSLRRLYLGLESGNDRLLGFLNKPGSARDALTLVRRIKEAGIHVGVIVMAGIGGERFAREHIEDTIAVVKAMWLDEGDILYISDFMPEPESEYSERSAAEGIRDLDVEEVAAQRKTITDSIRNESRKRGFKIAPYSIQDFIY